MTTPKKIIDPYFIIDALKAYNVFLFSPNKVEDLIKYLYKYGYTTSRNFNVMGGSDHYTSAIAIQLGNSPVSPIETKKFFHHLCNLEIIPGLLLYPFSRNSRDIRATKFVYSSTSKILQLDFTIENTEYTSPYRQFITFLKNWQLSANFELIENR